MDFIWSVSTTVKTYKEYVTATTITKKNAAARFFAPYFSPFLLFVRQSSEASWKTVFYCEYGGI